MRSCILFLFALFVTSLPVEGSFLEECQEQEVLFEKIYVNPGHILLLHEGIFFLNNEGIYEQAEALLSDSRGIYVVSGTQQLALMCPDCGSSYSPRGCSNPTCAQFRGW